MNKALQVIADFPVTDPNNMDAMNMRAIAQSAILAAEGQDPEELYIGRLKVTINGPQGSGKTRLKNQIADIFHVKLPLLQDAQDAARWREARTHFSMNKKSIKLYLPFPKNCPSFEGTPQAADAAIDALVDRIPIF